MASKKIVSSSISKQALARMRAPEAKNVAELVPRLREDYQIVLSELILKAFAQSMNYSVSVDCPDNMSLRDKQRADLQGQHDLTLFKQRLPAMLESFAYGRVAFEKIWAFEQISTLHYIHALEDLPFEHTEMKLTEDGAYDGLKLEDPSNKKNAIELDAHSSWWLALDASSIKPHGKSRMIGAPHRTWKRRYEALEVRDLFVQRFVLRGGVAHAPPEETDSEGQSIDVFDEIGKAYCELQAGGLMLFPNTRDKDGNYLYDFSEAKLESFGAEHIQSLIDSMDAEQLLSFGFPPKTVMEGDTVGSFAMVSVQMMLTYSVVEDVVDQILGSYNKYCVAKETARNFTAEDGPSIKLICSKLTDRPDDLAIELVKNWLTQPQLNPLVLNGAVDMKAVLDAVGIKVSPEFETKLEALKQQLALAAPAAQNPSGFSLSNAFPFR